MKKTENNVQEITAIVKKREETLPPILKDGVVFRDILVGRAVRPRIYDKMREAMGVVTRTNNVLKRYFLYPCDPIQGVPENRDTQAIFKTMEYVLSEVLAENLTELQTSHHRQGELIEKSKEYLKQYESEI